MKNLGKIGRIVNGKLLIVAHVLGKYIMEVAPYKLPKIGPKKCTGLICNITEG